MKESKYGAEMATTIPAFERSGERTEECYLKNELKKILPVDLLAVVNYGISHE